MASGASTRTRASPRLPSPRVRFSATASRNESMPRKSQKAPAAAEKSVCVKPASAKASRQAVHTTTERSRTSRKAETKMRGDTAAGKKATGSEPPIR